MKTYIILNIISIVLSIVIICSFAYYNNALVYKGHREYFFAEMQKGKEVDEISKKWEKRVHVINKALEITMLLSMIAIFILSIISVYLKPNFFGIILLVISGLILFILFLAQKFYRYSI